jgi:AraC-like DNA-binding protein/DNA-binding transcriptional MerR regulator
MSDLLDIGEVRSRTGLSASTLHYYERHGLIRSVERAGLRRQYDADTVDRLAVIILCQRAGFRLEEVAELLATGGEPGWGDLVRAKQIEVRARIQTLRTIERALSHALACPSCQLFRCEHVRAELELDAAIPVRRKKRVPDRASLPVMPEPLSEDGSRPTSDQQLRDLAWLRRVRDRIDREYAQPLDVEALARGVHMSAGHFSREFKRAYGESPYSYLMTRRIERAMALLRRGDLSVTEVCFAVGCSSLGTFSTRFTELVGMPPSTYQRQAGRASAGIPACVEKQVTRPVRNREALMTEPDLG